MYTPTQWSTSADKEKFYKHTLRFVQGGFKETVFYKWYYKRLSLCFGHIAHYNKVGFYDTWFATPGKQLSWIQHVLSYPCYGSPAHSYADVEHDIRKWLNQFTYVVQVDGYRESEVYGWHRDGVHTQFGFYGWDWIDSFRMERSGT